MKPRAKWSLAAIAVIFMLALAVMFPRGWHRDVPLPNPNGYDEFLAVLPQLVPNAGFWRTQEVAALRSAISQNSNTLARIRRALGHQWRVPLSNDPGYATTALAALSNAKALAQLFAAEGRLAELEGRTNDALRGYAECIQFGNQVTHGGLMIHDLVAIASRAIGVREAQRLLPEANAAAVRELLDKLSAIDRSMEPAEAVLDRETDWSSATFGPVQVTWVNMLQWKGRRESRARFRARHERSEAELRLLKADAALRLYRDRNGKYPAALSALVPDYFEAIPIDPFSGKPMIYQPGTNSYLLYSIGPDRKDDRGKTLTRRTVEQNSLEVEQGDLISSPPRP